MTHRPVRLRLSLARGFRLAIVSYATNQLPARRVDRTTPFGNPFRFVKEGVVTETFDEERAGQNADCLVAAYRDWLVNDPAGQAMAIKARAELRGHNLACWCKLDAPCHADVLLEVANA